MELAERADQPFWAVRPAQRPAWRKAGSRYATSILRDGAIEIGSIWFSPLLQRTRAATEAIFLLMQYAMDAVELPAAGLALQRRQSGVDEGRGALRLYAGGHLARRGLRQGPAPRPGVVFDPRRRMAASAAPRSKPGLPTKILMRMAAPAAGSRIRRPVVDDEFWRILRDAVAPDSASALSGRCPRSLGQAQVSDSRC